MIDYIKQGLSVYCELRKMKFKCTPMKVAKTENEVIRSKTKFVVGVETFILLETHEDEYSVREGSVKGPIVINYQSMNTIYSAMLEHISGKSLYTAKLNNDRYLVFDDMQSVQCCPIQWGGYVNITNLPQFKYLFQLEDVDKIDHEIFLFMSSYFHPTTCAWNMIRSETVQFNYRVSEKNANYYEDLTIQIEFDW